VKNQYFGDVNDYKKYGLLRRLSRSGTSEIAVCWNLTEDDARSDGSRIQYLNNPERWRSFEPAIFDFVRNQVIDKGIRSVDALSGSQVLPGCRFFADPLPDDLTGRDSYFKKFFRFAKDSDIVFFDPDNGLGITAVQRGKPKSSKYVYPCEIERAWNSGHSVLFYQHFPRRPRSAFLGRLVETLHCLDGLDAVFFFVTSHVVFVLLPRQSDRVWVTGGARTFAETWAGIVRVEVHPLTNGRARNLMGRKAKLHPTAGPWLDFAD
jgi:hypothetical protein